MALKKKVTSSNGITSEYHIINGMKVMEDRIEVNLTSYADESYRELEKVIAKNKKEQEKLRKQLLKEEVKEEPDTELMETLQQQIDSLDIVEKDYSVGQSNYRIPFNKEDSLSFTDIYNKLKTEAKFEGAEDC